MTVLEGGQGDQKASGDHNVLSSVCPESPGSPQFSHLRHGRGERGHHGLAEPVDGEAAPPARHGPRDPAALAGAVAGGGGAGRAGPGGRRRSPGSQRRAAAGRCGCGSWRWRRPCCWVRLRVSAAWRAAAREAGARGDGRPGIARGPGGALLPGDLGGARAPIQVSAVPWSCRRPAVGTLSRDSSRSLLSRRPRSTGRSQPDRSPKLAASVFQSSQDPWLLPAPTSLQLSLETLRK